MRLSVFTVMMRGGGYDDLESAARVLAEIGYHGVEWRVHEEFHISPTEVEKRAKSVGELCSNLGLELPALAPYIGIDQPDQIEPIFRGAQVMGCPRVRVTAPEYDRTTPYPQLLDQARRNLDQVEKLAQTYGVRAQLELHMGNIMPSASLGKRLVENRDPEAIGVIFDPGNMVVEGMENWRLGLELLGEHLSHVHVKNAGWYPKEDGKWQFQWAPLMAGIVDWAQVVEDLKSVGYQGYLSLEDFHDVPVDQKLREDFEAMGKLIAS